MKPFEPLHKEGIRMLIGDLSEKCRSSCLGADAFQTSRIRTHEETEYLGVRSRMITWLFNKQIRFFSVPLFHGIHGAAMSQSFLR